MSVTIDQIARRAGVSSSTVARVLRGDVKGAQQRSARNAAEILRISEELGYRPNWRARALSRGKTHTIGLLYDDAKWIFEDPMNDVATSFTEALQRLNYDLRMIPVKESSDWKELVYGSAVDGLAFIANVPEAARAVVRERRLPSVLLSDKFGDAPHSSPDDLTGGYLAARHLIGLGHKKVVFYVADDIRSHYSITERQDGYRRAMEEAGLSDEVAIWCGDTDEAMGRLLGADRPTAMVCYCHLEAMRICHGAWSHGLAVPTELSLVAFNDISATKLMTPALSVVGFDTAEMGRTGAEMLISQITNPEQAPPENVLIREKLIVRGTTAPPLSR